MLVQHHLQLQEELHKGLCSEGSAERQDVCSLFRSGRMLCDQLSHSSSFIAIQHLPFIAHNEDMNVGKGMVMLGIPCMGDEEWWIARHGCDNKTECLKYVVMHPEVSNEEIIRFYTYLK